MYIGVEWNRYTIYSIDRLGGIVKMGNSIENVWCGKHTGMAGVLCVELSECVRSSMR